MINLIPPAAKKIMVREYWTRVLTVWVMLGGTACLIVTLLLLPTYLLLSIKTSVIKEQAAAATQKVASYDVSATELQTANRQAQILLKDTTTLSYSGLVAEFETIAGEGVSINDFRFLQSSTLGTISLSGVATTREDLANFRDRLESDVRFAKVDLPISNLIKDRDLLFSMSLIIATTTPTS